MKSKSEVLQKLKQVRYRYLKKAVRKGLARHPYNCLFNKEIEVLRLNVGICTHPEIIETRSDYFPICDERLGDLSSRCEKFCPKRSKERIREGIKETLNSSEVGEIAYHYPDVAALIWVLDKEDLQGFEDLEEEPEEDQALVVDPVQFSWWGRVKQWWKGIF